MRVDICCVAIGGWYPRGLARMIQAFHEHSPGYAIHAWLNELPPHCVEEMVVDDYDYTPYAAKPKALWHSYKQGAHVAILLDCAFYPIRHIGPLVDHITRTGYYLCKNGANVGEWSSDVCLNAMGVTREEAFGIEEASSYCVGLDFAHDSSIKLAQHWAEAADDHRIIAGRHTSEFYEGRNAGHVSTDRRVKGHRHDQTALSILAHRLGMKELIARPRFTAYDGSQTKETVLVNRGIG